MVTVMQLLVYITRPLPSRARTDATPTHNFPCCAPVRRAMALKNPYGLTLELGAAEALAVSETAMYTRSAPPDIVRAYPGDAAMPTFVLPDDRCDEWNDDDDDEPTLPEPSPALASVRVRFRDSAVLRSDGIAGFAVQERSAPAPAPEEREAAEPQLTIPITDAAALAAAVEQVDENGEILEEGVESDEDSDDEVDMESLRLNYFVHNGYRYDGDVFELRPPQERSIASRPERVLEHKPAVLNHRQVFNRVYSEGTYNNRPSSLRQMRLSARLSAASWASISDVLAMADPVPPTPEIPAEATPEHARQRIGVLVEASLVTEEQAQRIALASAADELARAKARAPRLTRHIDAAAYPTDENEPERNNVSKKNVHKDVPKKVTAVKKDGAKKDTVKKDPARRKGRKNTEARATHKPRTLVKERAILQPVNVQQPSAKASQKIRDTKRRPAKTKKKTFWKTLVHL